MEHKTEAPVAGWRRHLLLITGIALPFALMAFVLLYQMAIHATIPAPRYAAVYGFSNMGYGAPYFRFDVVNDRLQVWYLPPLTDEQKNNLRFNIPRGAIYIQHDYTKPAQKFILTVPSPPMENKTPEQTTIGTPTEIPVSLPSEFSTELIEGAIAPDGYVYRVEYGRNSGGFFTDIFVNSYSGPTHTIGNGPRRVPLMFDSNAENGFYYGGDLKFIGWVKKPLS